MGPSALDLRPLPLYWDPGSPARLPRGPCADLARRYTPKYWKAGGAMRRMYTGTNMYLMKRSTE